MNRNHEENIFLRSLVSNRKTILLNYDKFMRYSESSLENILSHFV